MQHRVLIVADGQTIGIAVFDSEARARGWIADHAAILYPNALFKLEKEQPAEVSTAGGQNAKS